MHLSATVLSYNQSSEAHSAKETKPHYSDPEADPHANPDESDAEMNREAFCRSSGTWSLFWVLVIQYLINNHT